MTERRTNDNEPMPKLPQAGDTGAGNWSDAVQTLGKEGLRPPLTKRFYGGVTVAPSGAGFAVLLDGRGVKTPKKLPLVAPSPALANAIAAEWSAQGERIDPAVMPLTKLANSTIDAVATNSAEVAADIVAFAGTDALCYRARAGDELGAVQAAVWDPILAWAADVLGARLVTTTAVLHVAQPAKALEAVARATGRYGAWQLAPLHVMTTLTGSAVLALAVAHGRLSVDAAWTAAHVDEDWQIARWGDDEEARKRRTARLLEMKAAARFFFAAAEEHHR